MANNKQALEMRKGLEGVVIGDSTICYIDGMGGRLYYRGYNINDLADSSFEEVTYLLLKEKLPNAKELAAFDKELKRNRALPKHVVDMMKTFTKGMTPMEALRTVVSGLASGDPDARRVSLDDHMRNGISLIAKFPTIVAYYYRIEHGLKIIAPDNKLGHAANFMYMLTGKKPGALEAKAMDQDFVLHAEHESNASAFAVRVTISTLSDMHSALTTGIGTLKGPLHGGAAQEVLKMLEKIGVANNVDKYVRNALARHDRIMGYGHRIYRTYDPRARILRRTAAQLSKMKKNMRWMDMADKLEAIMASEKNLYPNVDFYSGIVYHLLGLPLELDSPIFAIGRGPGWVAHAIEQYKDNRLIRPILHYAGPLNLKFVPLKERH